ncbi:MAG: hypothetical protein R2713_23720 [Ilumatobacteraceae bacterium]
MDPAAERKVTLGGGTQSVIASRLTQPTPTGGDARERPDRLHRPVRGVGPHPHRLRRPDQVPDTLQFGHVVPVPGVVIEKVDPVDTVTMFSTLERTRRQPAMWLPGQTPSTMRTASASRSTVRRHRRPGDDHRCRRRAGDDPTTGHPTTGHPTTGHLNHRPLNHRRPNHRPPNRRPPNPRPPVATGAARCRGHPHRRPRRSPAGRGAEPPRRIATAGFTTAADEPPPCAGIGATAWSAVQVPCSAR